MTMTDLFATAADVAGRTLPENGAPDSFSLLPVLLGKSDHIAGRDSVFILGNGKDSAIAVRFGNWKLVIRYGAEEERGHELYELSDDPGELRNLAPKQTELVDRLLTFYRAAEANGRTRP